MAEIKRLDSEIMMPENVFSPSAMDVALERKRERSWAGQASELLRKNLISIAAMAVVLTILLQSIAIYAVQRNISDISSEIHGLRRSNETLRATVLQANNLDRTREEAEGQAYVARTGLDGLRVDLEYNNFTGSVTSGSSEGTKAGGTLIDRLLAVFE